MEAVDIMEDIKCLAAYEDAVIDIKEIGAVAMVSGIPMIWHITVGLM